MKRTLALLLALMLMLVGCGKPSPASSRSATPRLAEEVTLEALLDGLTERYELPAPAILDDDLMTRLLDIPAELRLAYRGYLSMEPQAPDQLVGVQAASGKAEAVAQLLEARRAFVVAATAQSPEDSRAKALAGQVFFLGDYVFLLVGGRTGADPVAEQAEMLRYIQDQFEK